MARNSNGRHGENWFKTRRNALGLSETEIAARLRASMPSIRNWEAERCIPDQFTNADLAEAYETTEGTIERVVLAQYSRIRRRRSKAKQLTGN